MTIIPYASTVSSLMYVLICTRPVFDVGQVSRYQLDPSPIYWQVVKKIFRYIKGTTYHFFSYRGVDLELTGYTDANWDGDLEHHKSTSVYVFLLNRVAISWASKKHTYVALSIMDAGFVATLSAMQEGV